MIQGRIEKYGLGGVKGWGLVPFPPLGSPSRPLPSPTPPFADPSPLRSRTLDPAKRSGGAL